MSDAIEVLKKYSTSCSVCKYNGGDQCKASGGEFGECRSAEELIKAIKEALLALEQKEKVDRFVVEVFNRLKERAEFDRARAKTDLKILDKWKKDYNELKQ